MIGAFVRVSFRTPSIRNPLRKIADSARGRVEAMPGLGCNAFTISAGQREATNFYLWESADAARAFFIDELAERLTRLYGVRPSVDFVQIAALVANMRT